MKVCSKCKQEKPYSEFSKDRRDKSGRKCTCKACVALYRKYSIRHKTYNRNYKISTKEWLIEYKKTLKCEICGEDRHYVLDFHHRNPHEKDFNISKAYKNTNKETIMKEIEKCMVVCSNCHREIHWLEKQTETVPMKLNITLEHLWEEN